MRSECHSSSLQPSALTARRMCGHARSSQKQKIRTSQAHRAHMFCFFEIGFLVMFPVHLVSETPLVRITRRSTRWFPKQKLRPPKRQGSQGQQIADAERPKVAAALCKGPLPSLACGLSLHPTARDSDPLRALVGHSLSDRPRSLLPSVTLFVPLCATEHQPFVSASARNKAKLPRK